MKKIFNIFKGNQLTNLINKQEHPFIKKTANTFSTFKNPKKFNQFVTAPYLTMLHQKNNQPDQNLYFESKQSSCSTRYANSHITKSTFLSLTFQRFYSSVLQIPEQWSDLTGKYILMHADESLGLKQKLVKKIWLDVLREINQEVLKRKLPSPVCFISYAWGNALHEQWVQSLATSLKLIGVTVLLDRWNIRPGQDIYSFVEKVNSDTTDFILVVGTTSYLEKYRRRSNNLDAKEPGLHIEARLLNALIAYSEKRSEKVIPLLLEGPAEKTFPPFVTSLHIDFVYSEHFENFFEVIKSIYKIDLTDEIFNGHKKDFLQRLKYLHSKDLQQEEQAYLLALRDKDTKQQEAIEVDIRDKLRSELKNAQSKDFTVPLSNSSNTSLNISNDHGNSQDTSFNCNQLINDFAKPYIKTKFEKHFGIPLNDKYIDLLDKVNCWSLLFIGSLTALLVLLYIYRAEIKRRLIDIYSEDSTIRIEDLTGNYITTFNDNLLKAKWDTIYTPIKLIALIGQSGAGKSYLAKAFASFYESGFLNKTCAVVWIFDCANEVKNLRKQFEILAVRLSKKISNRELIIASPEQLSDYELGDQVTNLLKYFPDFLLVFDNVEKYDDIKDFLPTSLKGVQGKILVTTQNTEFFPPDLLNGKTLKVEPMSDGEAKQLLALHLDEQKLNKEFAGVMKLINYLEGVPRYLIEAASYIKQHHISFDEYEKVLINQTGNVVNPSIEVKSHAQFKLALARGFYGDISAVLLTEPSTVSAKHALKLLEICSVLAPDTVSKDLLKSYLGASITDSELNEALLLLVQYYFIEPLPADKGSKVEQGDNFRLHRSIQRRFNQLVQEQEKNNEKLFIASYQLNLKQAFDFLISQFKADTRGLDRLYANAALVSHAEHLLQQAELHQNIVLPALRAELLSALGHHYMQRDDYTTSGKCLKEGFSLIEQMDKSSRGYKQLRFKILRYLGRLSLFTHINIPQAADNYLKEAVKLGKEIYGASHIDTIIALSDRAELLLHMDKSRWDQAEVWLKDILDTDIQQSRDVPYEQSRAYRRLGLLYLLKGDSKAAKHYLLGDNTASTANKNAYELFEQSNANAIQKGDGPIRLVDIYQAIGEFYLASYQQTHKVEDLHHAEQYFHKILERCQLTEQVITDKAAVDYQLNLHTNYRYKAGALQGLANIAWQQDDYFTTQKNASESLKLLASIYRAGDTRIQAATQLVDKAVLTMEEKASRKLALLTASV